MWVEAVFDPGLLSELLDPFGAGTVVGGQHVPSVSANEKAFCSSHSSPRGSLGCKMMWGQIFFF